MSIRRPVTVEALLLGNELVDVLALSLPQTKVIISARCKTLKNWIETERLNWGVVGVFEQANTFSRPHDNVAVSATRGPSLTVLGVS